MNGLPSKTLPDIPCTPMDEWTKMLTEANEVLSRRRGAKSACAKAVAIDRQDLRKILVGKQEPKIRLALKIMAFVRSEGNTKAS